MTSQKLKRGEIATNKYWMARNVRLPGFSFSNESTEIGFFRELIYLLIFNGPTSRHIFSFCTSI